MSNCCLRERFNVRVRKDTFCCWCDEEIKKGDKCYTNTSTGDGSVSYSHMHHECCEAWKDLSTQPGYYGDPDDFAWGEYERGGQEA